VLFTLTDARACVPFASTQETADSSLRLIQAVVTHFVLPIEMAGAEAQLVSFGIATGSQARTARAKLKPETVTVIPPLGGPFDGVTFVTTGASKLKTFSE